MAGEYTVITFFCPICKTELKAEDDQAGKSIVCSACQQQVDVPRPEQEMVKPARSRPPTQPAIEIPVPVPVAKVAAVPKPAAASGHSEALAQLRKLQPYFPLIRAAVWGLFTFVVLLVFLIFLAGHSSEAAQHAAQAGDACVWILVSYFIARAVDSVTRW